jgi:hypothetical protein
VTGRTRWLALLPASKAVTDDAGGPAWGDVATGPQQTLLAALGDLDQSDDATPLSTRATTRAWQRYDGVVHRAADPASLSAAERRRWHRHVRYVSALAGLVAPTDPLPAYRLEMAAVVEPLGGLGPFWRPHVTAALAADLTASGTIWLLTGGEYGRAVAPPDGTTLLEPRFVRPDGERSMPSATVKQARGQLARALAIGGADLATDPRHPDWNDVELLAAGAPVRLDRVEDDDTQVWRRDA